MRTLVILFYTRDDSSGWVQNFSPQKIYFCRVLFSIPSQGQTHRAKQSHPSQKYLQTAQIVLIPLNFRSKRPNKHKKILQALYQYLKDLMAKGVNCDTRDGCKVGWVHHKQALYSSPNKSFLSSYHLPVVTERLEKSFIRLQNICLHSQLITLSVYLKSRKNKTKRTHQPFLIGEFMAKGGKS